MSHKRELKARQQVRAASHCWHAHCFMLPLQAKRAANFDIDPEIFDLKEFCQ
ncbi:MAG: hypothetical protein U1F31_13960 [Steroidobacteraceae bacterium]